MRKPDADEKKTARIIYDMLTAHKTYNPKDYPSDVHFKAAWVAAHIHKNFVLKDKSDAYQRGYATAQADALACAPEPDLEIEDVEYLGGFNAAIDQYTERVKRLKP